MTMSGPDESGVEALGGDPDVADNLRIRSELMMELGELIREAGITQKEAARRMGVTQPRISDLVRGKIDKFAIDTLVNMFGRLGAPLKFVHVKKPE